MRTIRVELRRPIWGGGRPSIGVADYKLKGADQIEVEILYTRNDGGRSYPDKYVMSVEQLKTYPTQVVGGGVTLYVAPLADWRIV